MRVAFGNFYNLLTERFNRLNSQQQDALQQMSTGQRITYAADGPADMERAMTYRASKGVEQQFWRNAGEAKDIARSSEASLRQLRDIFTRAQEIATRARSGLTDAASFSAFEQEVNQLLEQALNTANNRMGGQYLHATAETNTQPFVETRNPSGLITSVAYVIPPTTPNPGIRIDDTQPVPPRTEHSENQNILNILNNLVALRNALTAQNSATVSTVSNAHAALEDNLLNSISRLGAVQYRISLAQQQSTERFEAYENLISRAVDLDFAEASVRLNRAQTAYQASIQSGARIANNSLLDYIR